MLAQLTKKSVNKPNEDYIKGIRKTVDWYKTSNLSKPINIEVIVPTKDIGLLSKSKESIRAHYQFLMKWFSAFEDKNSELLVAQDGEPVNSNKLKNISLVSDSKALYLMVFGWLPVVVAAFTFGLGWLAFVIPHDPTRIFLIGTSTALFFYFGFWLFGALIYLGKCMLTGEKFIRNVTYSLKANTFNGKEILMYKSSTSDNNGDPSTHIVRLKLLLDQIANKNESIVEQAMS
jgi:hypothetical protein